MTVVRIAQTLVLATLAWGTLAFGATYEWASRSMAVVAVVAVLLCWRAGRRSAGPGAGLVVCMVALLFAIATQLVPLTQAVIAGVSPATHAFLQEMNIGYRADSGSKHALSVSPPLTAWALAFCAVCFLWILALAKLLASIGTRWLARGLTILGVVISVVGIVQNAVYDGRVYGFWTPEGANAAPFGPFINRNHFAGWVLMVLPLTAGWFSAEFRRAMPPDGLTRRERFVWLSSRRANRLLLIGGAAAVMTLALILTLSRSGLLAMAAALIVPVLVAFRRQTSPLRKLAIGLAPIVAAGLLIAWVGTDTIADRFHSLGTGDIALRRGAWADAVEIARRFPVTGTGLNTYGVATILFQKHFTNVHFAQAHSDYLQLLAEGGALLTVPALILAIAFVALIVRRIRDRTAPEWIRSGAVVGMIAILMQEAVDFSLQMPANLLLFATLCAIAIHRSPARPAPRGGAETP